MESFGSDAEEVLIFGASVLIAYCTRKDDDMSLYRCFVPPLLSIVNHKYMYSCEQKFELEFPMTPITLNLL